ncbi:MAG: DNA gyrase subunit A, partial [Firmicutes bacterium]|nr:DNA gyrase subunit A [Bacillota bacterium]
MWMNEKKRIVPVSVHEEVKRSFLDYAMSVIVSRALPDVRDGFKPVHRRILYAMSEMGSTPDKPYRKSARIVGEVLGKYHPHGDTALYDAMVRLAQDFSTRYPLVDGHGNFGSQDGDAAAAMRYTEARLSTPAMELLRDLQKETIDFRPNFDESLEEPVVLPARFPNLLANGSAGIAVGMATNIPPHNLGELIDALQMLIKRPESPVAELQSLVKGPDFPTGGLIVGYEGINKAYQTGRGIIRMRGRVLIDKKEKNRDHIVITELPYQQNKAKLVIRIAELIKDKKIEGVTDLRDESDHSGVRIVLEVRPGYQSQLIINQLYQYTPLQQTYGIIMLALVNGEPRVLNLKEMLVHYLEHQKEVVERRTRFDLKRAEERLHIVEGLRIALSRLDEVIALIRRAPDGPSA